MIPLSTPHLVIYGLTLLSGWFVTYLYGKKRDFLATAKKSTGTVEAVDYQLKNQLHISYSMSGKSSPDLNPIRFVSRISFTDAAGTPHTFLHTTTGGTAPFVTGQSVNLIYDPKNISRVYLARDVWVGTILAGVLFGILAVISGLLITGVATIPTH